jgi:hypothetical protein
MNRVMLPEKSWCSSDSVVEEEMPPTNTLHKSKKLCTKQIDFNDKREATRKSRQKWKIGNGTYNRKKMKDFLAKAKKHIIN